MLLANVQSLDNRVDKIRARVAFQRDRDWNILCFMETLRIRYQSRYSHLVSSRIAPTETNISLVRRRAGVFVL